MEQYEQPDGGGDPAPTTVDESALADLVGQWLPSQRFFAGKQRPIDALTVRLLGTIGPDGAQIQIWLADLRYADGGQELYQLPLHLTPAEYETQAYARLGGLTDPDGSALNVYDAMVGKHLTQAFLHGIVEESVTGAVHFHRVAPATDIPLGSTSIVLAAEQSNTSAVFGDQAILKVFRRLDVGINPDIEIHKALSRGGGQHIARLLGHISADLGQSDKPETGGHSGEERASLAMLQDFLTTATDGWVLANASVRDLMAEADLHAEEAGGDFAAEAFRLGKATAQLHAELVAAFGTEQLSTEAMRERADAMRQRLEEALTVVPQLADVAPALLRFYEDFAISAPMTVQRVHGDLHLGQVLRTVNRWVVLDFEGEPAKSIAERRQLDSVLRDVAGMTRSFDYAANHQAIDTAPDNQQHYRAVEWAERNRNAFCSGYASAGPDPREQSTQLHAFEADKAVYEAVYEARNRPAWLAVPLASLGRLVSASDDAPSSGSQPWQAHSLGAHASEAHPYAAQPSADREDNR